MPRSPQRPHHDIMLSSTFTDLKEHRAVVIEAITRLELFPRVMELDAALPDNVIEASLSKVNKAIAYVGIIGYRYGQTPEDATRNPNKLSISELEYDEARRLSLPIYMFVMSDNYLVPRSAVDRDSGEQQQKLDAFRKRVAKNHIHSEFDSIGDLKAKAMQSLLHLRELLEAPVPESEKPAVRAILPLLAMPPYTPGHAFTGRVRELQLLSDWAVAQNEPVLVLEAIGGMGKSMLCWQWANLYARQVRPDLAGIFWYSFYERGADMSDFCAHALAYTEGRPVEDFKKRKTADLASELIPALRKRPWLVALDGLERVLAAYNRYDAAQVRDEEVEAFNEAPHDPKKRKAETCIRPADSDLLRTLTEAGPSKFLISSRLMPSALLNNSGFERPGVAHVKLIGLDPLDAEAMLRSVGVKGDSAHMRRYLDRNFGCHPLVVGVVGGLVRNYAPAPGDFDHWVDNPAGGAAVSLATMNLVLRRNHILKAALDDLDPDSRTLLARIALVSEAVDYQTLVELNPRRPDRPKEVEFPPAWMADVEDYKTRYTESKTAYDKYQQELATWRSSLALVEAENWLRETLQDLDSRGLLQWDREHAKYDLHPVTRGYAVSSITPGQREGVAQKVVDHFSSLSDRPYDEATSIDDLRNGLQVARTLLHLGKGEQAVGIIDDLASALFWNIEAFDEYLALVLPLFPYGWSQPAPGIEGADLSRLWSAVGISLSYLGNLQDAIVIDERVLGLNIDLDHQLFVVTRLGNLATCHRDANHRYAFHSLNELSAKVTPLLGDEELLALLYLRRLEAALHIGDFDAAERWWIQFDELPRPAGRYIYRPGHGESLLAQIRFHQGHLDEALLSKAERLARERNSRNVIRNLHWLRGEWKLSRGCWAEAVSAFEEAVRMAREVNLDASDSEARLAIAQVELGQTRPARETADRLSISEDPPHVELAELYLALGDTEKARFHVDLGYTWAWADGTPYVNWWHLQRCRKVLEALGDSEPQLPPFDPTTAKPFSFEAKLLAYFEKKRTEKEEEEAEDAKDEDAPD